MTDKKSTPVQQNFESSFLEAFDQFLEELGSLATRGVEHDEFYRFLLQRLQTLTTANQAAVWVDASNDCWVRASSVGDDNAFRISNLDLTQGIGQDIPVVLEIDRHRLLISKVDSAASHKLAISLAMPADESNQLQRLYGDLLTAVCDIAEEFHRNQLLNSQQQRFDRLASFIQLINNAHSSLDPQAVGFHLTNDSRSFLKADRVWLFQGPESRLLSCSGVANVNVRTRTFKHLQKVARSAFRSKKSQTWQQESGAGVESIDAHLSNYCQTNSINALYAVPISGAVKTDISAVLIVEMFNEHDRISLMSQLTQLTNCVDSSISNSLQHSQIPFRRSLTAFNWLLNRFRWGQLFRTVCTLAIVTSLLLSLFLIKTDFYIQVDGQLRPVSERHVFAPSDGVVESAAVEYGDEVSESKIVARMVSPDYQLKLKQLQAKLDAAQKKLEANQFLRSKSNQDSNDEIALGRLTAEIEQNRLEMESLNESIALYVRLMSELEIRAPINGQIISRDVAKTLLNRPVSAGSRLLTIADTNADWHVVFNIPDRELGYLNACASEDGARWDVEYRLASELDQIYFAQISRLDSNNTFDEQGEAIVKAYCRVEKSAISQLRVGQSVKGRVFCGRKSLFFIWTRDIRDFFRTNFFWM